LSKIKNIWVKLSRIGLKEEEGILEFREVILLNKVLIVSPVILFIFMPIEIILNGFAVVPLELAFLGVLLFPLLLQKYRLFWAARLYILIASHGFMTVAGILVGKGINNHVAMIPVMLFGIILFKKTRDKLFVFCLSASFYFTLLYFQKHATPVVEINDENRANFSVVFYMLSLFLTFLLGYYFLNINKEYEKIIMAQKDHLIEKNKEITDSINYAKRIQQAKLPDKNEISAFLKESFILFKPKDIVSGDFYFFHKKENFCFIAAADCTGHGVPGALMSMVASEQLNDAVRQHSAVEEILAMVNKGIKISLRQTGSADSTRDGMDIALCKIDLPTRRVSYSAANRPLWFIKKGQTTVEEIKATKKAIGGFTDEEQQFETHQLQFEQGDTIYIFTDGYADQFSGNDVGRNGSSFGQGKKLTTKKFRELLLANQKLSMKEQETVLNKFMDDWKGTSEQVDDILVIGIRF
jgi:serine phosphatase RsbU (regulator of sigma subunit)